MQVGVDVVAIDRIEKAIKKVGFLNQVFTENEIAYCEKKFNKYESYAGKFAAKEALAKALGKGFREISFKDIEVLNDTYGAPYIKYLDYDIKLSISHDANTAIAIVLIDHN